jgi:VIT1/CCC1 family predicted Fe2+/Mn2+ transporter
MRLNTRMAAGLAVLAVVALPATAAAEAPTPVNVKKHVRTADAGFKGVTRAVRAGNDGLAQRRLRRAVRELKTANKLARRVRGAQRRATLAGSVGSVSNRCTDALSSIVDEVEGAPQVSVARTISVCIDIREQIVKILQRIVPMLPEEARPVVAQLIAKLTTDGQDEVQGITDALETPGLPPEVSGLLGQALELATQAIHMATDTLEAILPMLPSFARPIVAGALGMVTQIIPTVTNMISGMLETVLGGLVGPIGGGAGGSGGGSGGSGGLFGGLLGGLFDGILGILPFDLPFDLPGFGWATS